MTNAEKGSTFKEGPWILFTVADGNKANGNFSMWRDLVASSLMHNKVLEYVH